MKNIEKIILLIIIIAYISIIFRTNETIRCFPFTEDGYYELTIARNIAQGDGITIEGRLTNGFQFLYAFLLVPIFWISKNSNIALRLILILNLFIYVISSYYLGKINFRLNKIPILRTMIIYLSCFLLFSTYFNGLETGLMMFLFIIFIYYENINPYLQGIILGLIVLARIDSAIFVVIFVVSLLFEKNYKKAVIIGIVSFLITLPLWIYNIIYFGSIFPMSFHAESEIVVNFDRFLLLIDSIGNNLCPFIPSFLQIPTIIFFIAFGIILKFSYKKVHISKIFYIVLFYLAVLAVWYFLTSFATWFYFRYLILLSLISIIYFSKFKYSIIISIIPIVIVINLFLHPVSRMFPNPGIYQLELAKKVPQNETIAAYQSGTLHFFRGNILNLDGKANYEVLKYKNNIDKYLKIKKIKYCCDWEHIFPPNIKLNKIDSLKDFYLFTRKDYNVSYIKSIR